MIIAFVQLLSNKLTKKGINHCTSTRNRHKRGKRHDSLTQTPFFFLQVHYEVIASLKSV